MSVYYDHENLRRKKKKNKRNENLILFQVHVYLMPIILSDNRL
jgi:hypothetical protein